MNIIIGILGFSVGLFLWSFILGGLFGLLPIRRKLNKEGRLKSVGWLKIALVVIIPTLVILLSAKFITPFFIGTLPAGIIMLLNLGKVNENLIQSELSKLEGSHEK
jgi:hypothetical protein